MASRVTTVLDHPDSKPARYLREHRLRLTLWIGGDRRAPALIVHVLPHLAIYVLAVVAIAFWFDDGAALHARRPPATLTWIFAASQALAVLIPSVLLIAKWLAVSAIAVIAAIAPRDPLHRARTPVVRWRRADARLYSDRQWGVAKR